MADEQYLTKEGLEKIKQEVFVLKTQKRKEISQRIEEALKLGDISENAEYHEAKDEQGFIEAKIREFDEILKRAVVITNEQGSRQIVEVGSTILVKFADNEKTFTIVGPSEANPTQGFISNQSPLGQAFIGKKIGDTVQVVAPAGILKYKILSIE